MRARTSSSRARPVPQRARGRGVRSVPQRSAVRPTRRQGPPMWPQRDVWGTRGTEGIACSSNLHVPRGGKRRRLEPLTRPARRAGAQSLAETGERIGPLAARMPVTHIETLPGAMLAGSDACDGIRRVDRRLGYARRQPCQDPARACDTHPTAPDLSGSAPFMLRFACTSDRSRLHLGSISAPTRLQLHAPARPHFAATEPACADHAPPVSSRALAHPAPPTPGVPATLPAAPLDPEQTPWTSS